MKRTIRLTESDLHNIIKESVYQVLSERIKSEKGMTDDEVRNRRLRNFMLDNDDEYEDSIYDDKQESYKDKMNKKRIKQHYIKHPKHHNVIKESVNKVLNEVQGWALEESDITVVNDESDGKPYMVRIWSGSGYLLPAFKAFANNEQDALEHVVAYLDNEGENYLFADKEYSQAYAEAEQEGDEEELELLDDIFYCVDATMYGASTPHFVRTENLQVYPYKFGNK